jgi:hypothetical protein
MSIKKIYNFDDESSFNYDSSKVNFTGDLAKLQLLNQDNAYPVPFILDNGYTYNPLRTVFTGARAEQKSQRFTASTFAINYNNQSKNAQYGDTPSLIPLLDENTSIINNELLFNSNSSRIEYNITNCINPQQGTIEFWFRPGYMGKPSQKTYFFDFKSGDVQNNRMRLSQDTDGAIRWDSWTNTGSSTINSQGFGSYSFIAGQLYKISFNWDFINEEHRMFINGVQQGLDVTRAQVKDSDKSLLNRYGIPMTSTANPDANFRINNIIIYDEVQYTADYTPDRVVSNTEYLEDRVIHPEFQHIGPGYINQFLFLDVIGSSNLRFSVEVDRRGYFQYWNGTEWAISDNSYEQGNDLSTFNDNLSSIDSNQAIYGRVAVHFPNSNELAYVNEIIININEDSGYSTDETIIIPVDSISADAISDYQLELDPVADTYINTIICLNGVHYWFNGSAWVVSNGTLAESNTEQEVKDNLSTLPILNGIEEIRFIWILKTDDSFVTPELQTISINYDFFGVENPISKTIVWGYYRDQNDLPLENKEIQISLNKFSTQNTNQYSANVKTITTGVGGYWETDLIPSDTMNESGVKYIFDFKAEENQYKKSLTVPAVSEINFNNLS